MKYDNKNLSKDVELYHGIVIEGVPQTRPRKRKLNNEKHTVSIDINLPKKFREYLSEFREFTYLFDPILDIHIISVCHNKDNFSKRIGRAICIGRYNKFLSLQREEPWVFNGSHRKT